MPLSCPPTLVPAARTQATTRAGNSTFIAVADRVASVEEARALVADLRRLYPDATPLLRLRRRPRRHRHHGSSDDGEPSGTAGRPILAVVNGSGLGDVAVVVIRHFGGTKLGTGGLVRAYTDAAQAVLAECPRTRKIDRVRLVGRTTYALFDVVRRVGTGAGGDVGEGVRGGCRDHGGGRRRRVADVAVAVSEATAGAVQLRGWGDRRPATATVGL
ncbi:MAG: YigZ family protein [Ardenticatenales bacterium]|nr:YigZ family protein [Ardenticatenales bacterium]